MKSVVIVIAYFAFMANGKTVKELSKELEKKMTEVGMECAEKLNINEAAMKELSDHKIPTEHDGKCVILCVYQEFGWMDDKGNFDLAKGQESMAELKEVDAELYEKFNGAVESCKDIKDEDLCEMVTKGFKCWTDEITKNGVALDTFGLNIQ